MSNNSQRHSTEKWMCCICQCISRNPDSVQCYRCLACAHCTCAGFRTYSDARESDRLFFCNRCKTNLQPVSPIIASSPSATNSKRPPRSPSVLSKSPRTPQTNKSLYTTPCGSPTLTSISLSSSSPSLQYPESQNPFTQSPISLRALLPPPCVLQSDSAPFNVTLQPPQPQARPVDHDYATLPQPANPPRPPPLMSRKINPPESSVQPDLPNISDIHEIRVSTLDHIPKACRDSCAFTLSSLYNAVVANPSFRNWHLLFLFPKCILFTPACGGRNSTRPLSTTIQDRLKKWFHGLFQALWQEAQSNQQKINNHTRRRKSHNPPKDYNCRRAEKLTRSGQYCRGLKALISEGLADDTDKVFAALQAKHP